MSAYGNQQKIRNFEKIGTKLVQNVIHGDPLVNALVIMVDSRGHLILS